MKKQCVLMAIILLFTLVAGCKEKPSAATQETEPAKATDAANPTDATSAADPTEATNTGNTGNAADPTPNPDAPVILTPHEEFDQLTGDNEWYWRALGCVFAAPEEISLKYYFYNGVGDKTKETKEELDFIVDAYKKKNPGYNGQYNYIRMPAAKLNEGLAILGLTLEDVKIPDSWAYYDKLDNYYAWRTDAYGVEGWSVTKVEKDNNGIVRVYWETDGFFFTDTSMEKRAQGAKMVYTMQLQEDGTYRVLSNLPQE